MLNFVIGKAGTGKTTEIYNRLCTAQKQASENNQVLLFVPDQFEFETEKIVSEMLNEQCQNIKITGFSKLSTEILHKFAPKKQYADDTAKEIIMYRVLKQLQGSLSFYNKIAGRRGFADMMLGTITQLKSAGIAPDIMANAVSESEFSPVLSQKLTDIALIFAAYNAQLQKSYADRQDNLLAAAEYAVSEDYFAGATVFIDGFDTFTGEQLRFLKPLIQQSDNVTVALLTDQSDTIHFSNVNGTIARLSSYANEEFLEIKTDELIESPRYKNQELLFLRDNIHIKDKQQYANNVSDITIAEADDIYSETEFVAAKISQLVKEKNYNYKDIAILMKEPVVYASTLESTFGKFNIPVFMDIPEPVSNKPLVKLILFALKAADTLQTEDILRYIKTGFVRIIPKDSTNGKSKPVSFQDLNMIEEFCAEWGLKGKDWLNKFPVEQARDNSPQQKKLVELEQLREGIMTPLIKLRSNIIGKNGDEITKALCCFLLDDLDINAGIQGKCQDFTTQALRYDKALSEEYNQLWDMLMGIFESAFTAMEGYPLSIREYSDIISAVFAKTSFAKPPQVMDSAIAGGIERTRINGAKAVFVMGANDGILPALSSPNKTFTSRETEELVAKGLEIFPDRKGRYSQEQLTIYKALTLSEELLFVSYPLISVSGSELAKSEVVDEIMAIFPHCEATIAKELSHEFYCRTKRIAKQYLARSYRDKRSQSAVDLEYVLSDETEFIYKLKECLSTQNSNNFEHKINPYIASKMFDTNVISPTYIEALNACPFSFFCKYGLNIKEKQEKDLTKLELGSIIHYCIQQVFVEFGDGLKDANEEDIAKIINLALEKYLAENFMNGFGKTARFHYLYSSICDIVLKYIKQFQREFSKSSFKPKYFELCLKKDSTGSDISTKPFEVIVKDIDKTNTVYVEGKIDRVDILENNGENYVRVVDYKTGNTTFDIGEIYYGMKMQMLMYLFALCDEKNKVYPSAVMYYPAKEGKLATDRNVDDKSQVKNWTENHVQTGLIITDNAAADDYTTIAQHYKNDFKANKAYDTAQLKSEQFDSLREFTRLLISNNLSRVRQGEISASPYCKIENSVEKKPCTYCKLEHICGVTQESLRQFDKEKINEVIMPKDNKEA